MNQQQIIQEFTGYPLSTKSAVLRELLKAYEDDLVEDGRENGDSSVSNGAGTREEIIAKRKDAVDRLRGIAAKKGLQNPGRELSIEERLEIVESLSGVATSEGRNPPSDDEWREERTKYLLEKYK